MKTHKRILLVQMCTGRGCPRILPHFGGQSSRCGVPESFQIDHRNGREMYSVQNADTLVNRGAEYEQPTSRIRPYARRAIYCGTAVKRGGFYRGARKLHVSIENWRVDSGLKRPPTCLQTIHRRGSQCCRLILQRVSPGFATAKQDGEIVKPWRIPLPDKETNI
jgi:hypothetical protein